VPKFGVLVGAQCRLEGRLFAVINAMAVDGATKFGERRSVSPKKLSADEKLQRWRDLWFPDIRVEVNGGANEAI